MIHRIYSSLPSFKNLTFHSGLNVLIAEKARAQPAGKHVTGLGKLV